MEDSKDTHRELLNISVPIVWFDGEMYYPYEPAHKMHVRLYRKIGQLEKQLSDLRKALKNALDIAGEEEDDGPSDHIFD